MKKLITLLLCFVLLTASIFVFFTNVYAEKSQLDIIIDFAKSKIGSTKYVGECQGFVHQCYKAGGIDNGIASSALAAWDKWGVSTSKTNIPVGACVYFDENVGSSYGHVGIYIGNNKMIHSQASAGKVVESSLTWYFDNCYLGWGWQGGVQPSTSTTFEKISDIYLLTSPDGFQTIRSQPTTDSVRVCDIPSGTYVTVTKYANDGQLDWGYVEYNNQEGWICLYYSTKHISHSYGNWQTVEAATCTSAGTQKRTCECGDVQSKSINALGHNYSTVFTVDKYASCTVAGSKSKHCTRCSSTTEKTSIPATGHSYGNWQTVEAATCTSAGTQKRTCECGDVQSKSINALGHNYSLTFTVDIPSTCSIPGSKSKHCNLCSDKSEVTTIPPKGHNYDEWQILTNPTCTATGSQKHSCLSCNHEEHRTISSLGHTYSTSWTIDKSATCITTGRKSHHCTHCNAQKDITTVPATGHLWSEWVITKPSTYEDTGLKIHECMVSGCSRKESAVIAKLSIDGHIHNFYDWVTETSATCTENGIQKQICSICNSYETREISANGHSFGEWTVERNPSCEQGGIQKRSCLNCTEIETISFSSALGHDFGEWQKKIDPTSTTEGIFERLCSNCSKVETQTIPKLDIDENLSENTPSNNLGAHETPSSELEHSQNTPSNINTIEKEQSLEEKTKDSSLKRVIIICTIIVVISVVTLILFVFLKRK